jgi:predicted transcriptional regulator
MESTTLEQAVESIIENPEAQAEEQNLDEVEGQEVSDDEAVIEAEGLDDTEELSSEDDGEIDYEEPEAEDAEPDQEMLYTVKIDGVEEKWTLEELKRDASGQKAINNRFQEIAKIRKEFEQKEAEVAKQIQSSLDLADRLQKNGMTPPTQPNSEDYSDDPIGYMQAKILFDEAKSEYDQTMYQVQVQRQQQELQQQQAQAQAEQTYLQEQAAILIERIPEIADPEKGDAIKKALSDTGVAYGFSEQEMSMVVDARYIDALNDARKWRNLVSKRKATQSKGGKARPVVKAGTKKQKSSGVEVARNKAQQRLAKTGSIEDAISLMLNND